MAITVPKPQNAHSNCPSACKEHRRGKLNIILAFNHLQFLDLFVTVSKHAERNVFERSGPL